MVGIASIAAVQYEEPQTDEERPKIAGSFSAAKGILYADNDDKPAIINADQDSETEILESLDLNPYNPTFTDIILSKLRAGLQGEAIDRAIERMRKLGIEESTKLRAYLAYEIEHKGLSDRAQGLLAILNIDEQEPAHKPPALQPTQNHFRM